MQPDPTSVDRRALLQNALVAVEKLQAKLDAVERAKREPIAIIGIGCRFPGQANDPQTFWQLLREGVDTVTEVPSERWDVESYYDPDPDMPGKAYSRWGAFLKEVDQFDPQFFEIAPREAMSMDPQQRLLLEVAWEALENAGQAPASLAASQTGVFVGLTTNDYAYMQTRSGGSAALDAYFGSGVAHSIAAGRLSYFLGLQGPNMAVDTACSSSLVATHLACQSLRARECQMAIAGGVNLVLSPDGAITTSRSRMMSFEGRCKTFDASADGYVRGEGCGVVILKRLSDAIAAGDNILAVILGTALNQDGRSNGLTAPNGLAQEAVIRAALANGNVEPKEVTYVEAHGTGTTLGDPIEIRALGEVFGQVRSRQNPLLVGSVKTNVGHLEAAAGIVGLIKIVLSLQNKTIPPHLHLREPNPHIPWDTVPVAIPVEPTPWIVAEGSRRIAGLSSFGFSGTNAHMIIAEAPVLEAEPESQLERPWQILSLSAKSVPALKALAGRFEQYLAQHPAASLADLCGTANAGRSHFKERLALVAESAGGAHRMLADWLAGESPAGLVSDTVQAVEPPELVFMFTGQGSQMVNMGRQLYETQPTFRQILDRCNEILQPYLDRPLLSVLYPEDGDGRLLDETVYTQPALFVLEYALAELWRAWGVIPAVVVGHSVGEYVAACLAGIFSLEDGLRLIAARGRLMQALPAGGEMVAVFAGEAEVSAAIAPYRNQVSIAAFNGPENIVISGAGTALQKITEALAAKGFKTRRLAVSHAFHSPLMEPMLAEFSRVAASITYSAPQIGLISNVTGRLAGHEVTQAAYWRQHILAPVQFAAAVQTLHEEGYRLFVEVGPKPTLLSMGQRCLPEGVGTWLPSLRPGRDDWQQMLESLGTLYTQGVEVNWAGLDRDYPRRRLALPTYPFQRKRYWLELEKEPLASSPQASLAPSLHPLLGQRLRSLLLKDSLFESQLGIQRPAFLDHHRIYGTPLFPATGYVEMALAAAGQCFGSGPCSLEEIVIQEALALPEAGERTVQIALSPLQDGVASFQIFSLEDGAGESWKVHATGKVRPGRKEMAVPDPVALAEVQSRCSEAMSAGVYYQQLAGMGVAYGPSFQGITQIWRRPEGGEALGQVSLPENFEKEAAAYQLHPALLDGCFQLLGIAMMPGQEAGEADKVYVPVGLARYQVYRPGCRQLWSQAAIHLANGKSPDEVATGDLRLFDDEGRLVAEVVGLRLKRVSRDLIRQIARKQVDEWLYEVKWQRQEPAVEAGPDNSASGSWLIFADETEVADSLVAQLRAQGDSCTMVRPGESYQALEADSWQIDPASPEDFRRLLTERKVAQPYRGVIHLWSLNVPQETSAVTLSGAQAMTWGSALNLVQSLAATGQALAKSARLWLVTQGSQPVAGVGSPLGLAQAPLWGLGRTVALEYPELGCVCLDLDPAPGIDQGAALLREVHAPDGENQVALRRGSRYIARLISSVPAEAKAVELVVSTPGMLDSLALQPAKRQPPKAGEVEVRVQATGLNFRDVLNALGMLPGPAIPLGNECTGVVVAVGEGVTEVAVGDEVIALVAGAFKAFVTVPAAQLFPKPVNLNLVEAATIPTTFLTAYYGLHHLAAMKAGDRVLIHAAAGGVGLAAVQLAQRAGAEIFATAGSPEKRAFLRAMGVPHVLDSRSLHFADEIMDLTGGAGVNIVLNSLANEFITKSLSILADGGYFLELGKLDQWDEGQVARLNPTLHYHRYDLGGIMDVDPAPIRAMLRGLLAEFETGTLKPLPAQTFALEETGEAFQYMARAKHIGKVVVTQLEADLTLPGESQSPVEAEATYLVTGGLGGLGLVVARWLVEQGARNLVLVGRNRPKESACEILRELEQAGARLVVAQADISQEADVVRILREIQQTMPPLRGIIHAAGVLEDGLLPQQSWSAFEKVMAPKVWGSWHLHKLTQTMPLRFFVLFSAGAGVLGSPGQGNYGAANTFLDALAYERRRQGLPALSINWGPWTEVGMAAALDARSRERWAAQGIDSITPKEGVQILAHLLGQNKPQVAVLPIDWGRFKQQLGENQGQPLIQELLQAARVIPSPVEREATGPKLLQQLAGLPPVEQRPLLLAHVQDQISRVLGLDPGQALDPQQGLTDLGMDSLMAVEISKRLQTSVGAALPATLAFEYSTIEALTHYLATEVLVLESTQPVAKAAVKADETADLLAELEGLSEDELEDAVLKELEDAGY